VANFKALMKRLTGVTVENTRNFVQDSRFPGCDSNQDFLHSNNRTVWLQL